MFNERPIPYLICKKHQHMQYHLLGIVCAGQYCVCDLFTCLEIITDTSSRSLGTARPFIYEIYSDVMLWRPFRRTISKMEDSNKETSLKEFIVMHMYHDWKNICLYKRVVTFNKCSKKLERMSTSDLWNYIFPCSYYLTYSHVYFYTYVRVLNPNIGGDGRVCTIGSRVSKSVVNAYP